MQKLILVLVLALAMSGTLSAVCTPTGFFRDGINMTAALINPVGTVTGPVDATGCHIAVYYDRGKGTVKQAEIFSARYFGVAVNGDAAKVAVDVLDSIVHDIGETPLDGAQHGVAIYYRALGTGTASGKISGNTVRKYQKGGIVANGAGASVNISDNIVRGEGTINWIAQNGIQAGYGVSAQIMRNTVTGNAYSGANWASAGILLVGDYLNGYVTGIQIVGNTVVDNQVGVYLSNCGDNLCNAPITATNNKVVNNTITSGIDPGTLLSQYSAGVTDIGNNDKIIANTISGIGYTAPLGLQVDAVEPYAVRPKVHATK